MSKLTEKQKLFIETYSRTMNKRRSMAAADIGASKADEWIRLFENEIAETRKSRADIAALVLQGNVIDAVNALADIARDDGEPTASRKEAAELILKYASIAKENEALSLLDELENNNT